MLIKSGKLYLSEHWQMFANVSAMSSGGFGTTHYQIKNND